MLSDFSKAALQMSSSSIFTTALWCRAYHLPLQNHREAQRVRPLDQGHTARIFSARMTLFLTSSCLPLSPCLLSICPKGGERKVWQILVHFFAGQLMGSL